jgi:hypothetical protein
MVTWLSLLLRRRLLLDVHGTWLRGGSGGFQAVLFSRGRRLTLHQVSHFFSQPRKCLTEQQQQMEGVSSKQGKQRETKTPNQARA